MKQKLIETMDEYLRAPLNMRISLLPEIWGILSDKEIKKETAKVLKKKELDAHQTLFLEYLLRAANLIYNETSIPTGLTDSEYDALLALYMDVTGNNLPVTELIAQSGEIVSSTYSIQGTLSKIYKITDEDVLKNSSQKTLDEWIKSMEKIYETTTGKSIDLWKEEIEVFMKFDGLSVMIEYDEDQKIVRALTRGDVQNDEALNITAAIKDAKIPKPFPNDDQPKFPFCVKYEAMMADEDLPVYNEEFKRDYKNTRSATASIINAKDFKGRTKYLRFIPHRYTYFNENGKEALPLVAPGAYDYPHLRCTLNDVEQIRNFAFQNKTVYDFNNNLSYRCDGAVIRFVNEALCTALGNQDHKPRYEVAYKFTEEYGYSKITDIYFQVGVFGRVTPVVIFDPIKLKGNTITNAAISYPRFRSLHLGIGDICKISYDIIPYLEFDESDPNCERAHKHKDIPFLKNCPYCGSTLVESENKGFIECTNKDCECRKKGKIVNFLTKIGVEGISVATIETLYEKGIVKSIPDLFQLKEHKEEIIELEGFGKKKFKAMVDAIDNHRGVYPATFLAAIGIPGVSVKKFQQILDIITYDQLIELAENKNYTAFSSMPGVKDIIARKIVDGICDNIPLIEQLEKDMVLLEQSKEEPKFYCVFTKIRSKELEEYIQSIGGRIQDNVTKITDFVIVPNKHVSSSKTKRANEMNIPIVEIDNVVDYCKQNWDGGK